MPTRSSSNLVGETSTNPKRHNRRRSKQIVEPFSLEETPVVTMADQRTMAELLRAPTEGYAEAIVVPPIPAEHFELKHNLINLLTSKQFFGFEKEDPHAHIRYFNKITSTFKYKDVPESSIKLILFPFSIDLGSTKNLLVIFSLGTILLPSLLTISFLTQKQQISGMKFQNFNNVLADRSFQVPTWQALVGGSGILQAIM
ncbi:hypothetical protein Tco_1434352 [Tanacetum coccineum]